MSMIQRETKASKAPAVRLHIHNRQEIYTQGDIITGVVEFTVPEPGCFVSNLTIELIYREVVSFKDLGVKRSPGRISAHKVSGFPRIVAPGCRTAPFEIKLPERDEPYYSPTLRLDAFGKPGSGVFYSLRAALETDLTATVEDNIDLTVYPPMSILERTGPNRARNGHVGNDKFNITLTFPYILKQAPGLLDISLSITPKQPVIVQSIEILLEKVLVIRHGEVVEALTSRESLATYAHGKLLKDTLVVDGAHNGWGLKGPPLPPAFAGIYMTLTYDLRFVILTETAYSFTMGPLNLSSSVWNNRPIHSGAEKVANKIPEAPPPYDHQT